MGKSSKDKRDAYYRLAKEQSWRARSAFKLLQIDETFDIFGPDVYRVVDLCAAPGSWSQVLSRVLIKGECLGRRAWLRRYREERQQILACLSDAERSAATTDSTSQEEHDDGLPRPRAGVKIVAVDLQPIAPLDGIISMVADITHPTTIPRILRALDPDLYDVSGLQADSKEERKPVDLVISDGAPDVTGLHDLDIYIQAQLLYAALNLALRVLKPGGKFIAKIFRGKDVDLLYAQLFCFFDKVSCAKPRSSRASSLEAFVVCEGFRCPEGFNVEMELPLNSTTMQLIKQDTANAGETLSSAVTALELAEDVDTDEQSVEKQRLQFEGGERGIGWIAPLVACGDLSSFDADATYHLPKGHVSLDPVRPPINPPYKAALEEKRRKGGFYGKTKT